MNVLLYLGIIAGLVVLGAQIGARWARAEHEVSQWLTQFHRDEAVDDAADADEVSW